ncbi:MAG: tetratricopeptide repeat protein, partial [Gemmatimonadetes bacterium]|nr:tetratricopeptide repeat protein [Gemmatimonadota bacterium]
MADSSRAQLRKLKDEYARNPGSRVFVHLAEAHRKAGELRQAQQVLTEGLRRHVDYPSGLVVLAKVLADQGDDERATAVWRDVVRLDPENVVALRALADIAEAAGRRDEALELYRQLLRLENGAPDDDDTQFAAPSYDDPEPVAAAQEPERAPVAAPAKSRFSWLVRSVTRGVAEPKEPARSAFNLQEALAGPAGAVAAMDAPAAPEPVLAEAVPEPAQDVSVATEVEAPEQLNEVPDELPPPESAAPQAEPEAPAVQNADQEVEPAVPLPDSETEPPAVAEEAQPPAEEFEGILPVDELDTFEGILPASAEVDDLERIIPGDIVVLSADRELDTAPPELGEVEAPAEDDEETEEIGREEIETQEEIVADAGIAAELDEELEDVIGEPQAAGPDEEIEETVSEHAGAVLDAETVSEDAGAVLDPIHRPRGRGLRRAHRRAHP